MNKLEKLKLILGGICLFCVLTVQAQQTIPFKIDQLMEQAGVLQNSEVGIAVYDLTAGEPVYRYQSQKLYRPASVEKIITSVTALATLGEKHEFQTRIYHTGTIHNDTLSGDLYLVGGFDPEFMDTDLDNLVNIVAEKGIRHITGRVVGDVSMTDSLYWGPGWSWDDTPLSFQPYLSPLMLNRGCVDVTVWPAGRGAAPHVTCLPESGFYRIDNQALSHTPKAGKLTVTRDWLYSGNTIRISGNAFSRTVKTINIYTSKDLFFTVFCERLAKRGIAFSTSNWGILPDTTSVLLGSVKRNLFPVLKRALKKSDNLCAEALFYHLAANYSHQRWAGTKEGQEAIYRFMRTELGFNPSDYRIMDGSGVSLYNYISPELLLAYLKYAYYHASVFQPFYEALPIAGIDGTLQHRMKIGKAYRNVRAKTGTVTGVSSLAGYVKAANGNMLAFVIINQNVLNNSAAHRFQDRLCEILATP